MYMSYYNMENLQIAEKKVMDFLSTIEKVANGENVDISNIQTLEGKFKELGGSIESIDYVNLPFLVANTPAKEYAELKNRLESIGTDEIRNRNNPRYTQEDPVKQAYKQAYNLVKEVQLINSFGNPKVVPYEQLLKAFRGYYYTGISESIIDWGSSYGIVTRDEKKEIRREVIQFKIPASGNVLKRDENNKVINVITADGLIDIKKITGDYERPAGVKKGITTGVISKYVPHISSNTEYIGFPSNFNYKDVFVD